VGMSTPAEVCALVRDRAELFVEIKGAGIEDAVLDVLDGHGGRSAIHGFDHQTIGRIAARGGARRLGVLFEDAVPDVAALLATHGALDAWPHHSIVDARLVDAVRRAGGRVIAWTVNAPADVARLTDLGVDGICTDDVTLLASR
jgi:glycerophosphoryl diester phosphodiesterase